MYDVNILQPVTLEREINSNDLPIIVIGTGSVGVRFVHELLHLQPSIKIKVFGGEEQQPYSRENLSKMLAGDLTEDALHAGSRLPASRGIETFLNNPITKIDKILNIATDSHGVEHHYKNLVLAVGSAPRMLKVEGNDLDNVFTFRDVHDAELLKSRQTASRRTVVIGGGLVGLDVAYAMTNHNTQVTVIENSSRLMYHQLDDHASVYLRLYLDDLGIDVHKQTKVTRIEGKKSVEGVVLDDGEIIPCDTVIISIGINPRLDLARQLGLKVNRGIVINDRLQTSNASIYAIGECAEHRGRYYGLVKPGFEQAEVLAKIFSGKTTRYKGSTTMSQLKVIEYPILSIGDNGEGALSNKEIMYRDIKKMVYRKLVLNKGHLQGVVAAGPWKNSEDLHAMVENKKYIWPWQRSRFSRTGQL
ncbi:MAG: FAD-dependent oxidoreductase [Cocleimonas sp.]